MSLGLAILIILVIALSQLTQNAEARPHDIGLQIGNSCLALIKNNLTSNCPNYEQLLLLYPDNSLQRISGEFVYKDGYLQRETPPYKNHYEFYKYETDSYFWVDPPADILDKIRLIIIEPRIDEYKIGGQTISNFSLQVGYNRYVDPDCKFARISAQDYLFLTGDTIRLMKADCNPFFTNFDEVKIKTWDKVLHDITTSYKYFLDNWYKEAIQKCKTWRCI